MVDDTGVTSCGGGGSVNEVEDLYGSASEGDNDDQMGGSSGSTIRAQTMAEMRDIERLLLRTLDYDRTNDAAADVYEALGVVYNVSRDYDAAINSFRLAINAFPNDYQLRNKLGATLACQWKQVRRGSARIQYSIAIETKVCTGMVEYSNFTVEFAYL
jgi:tetratricopeptide (TPR) repeat protein